MKYILNTVALVAGFLVVVCFPDSGGAQTQNQEQKTRRSQRVVPMQAVQATSPNGLVKFTLLPNAERLSFMVTRENTTVIEPSPITMLVDGYDLSSGVVFKLLDRYEVNETYFWNGVHGTATNHCNGIRISLANDLSLIEYVLEVRAFNDGIAFRHVIPGGDSISRVPEEHSTFVIPTGSTVWHAGMDGHYEAEYRKEDISTIQRGEWAGPPVTFKLAGNGCYASITEANLQDYSGMALESDGRRGWIIGLGHRQPLNYPFELRYGRDEARRLGKPASISGTITTPWRVVIVAPDLNGMVNSDIVHNLCPSPDKRLFPDGSKTEWIKPGRAVWRYLDEGGDRSLENMKEFSRLAGELGFEHHIIEGFWSRWSDVDLKDLVDYSKQYHVSIWLWKHSKSLVDPQTRHDFLERCNKLGITGLKIDFFDHEAKAMIDLYRSLLKETAEHRLLVDFHGANKPTGESRTWPNELTREAIRGMESRSLQDRATHNTTLPFTRLLAGHAEYTPVIFGERRRNTTWAHQVASAAIITAPLLTYAANPVNLLANPCREMIKSIPSIWDETVVLPPSEIGEVAVFARRSRHTWFLAILNGPSARTIRVPLSFLGPEPYNALLIRDNKDSTAAVNIEKTVLKRDDSPVIELHEGGGFIARFSRK